MADASSSVRPDASSARAQLTGRLALAAAALFWSGNFVAGRALRDGIDPVTLNALRWTIATVILAPFVLRALWTSRAVLRANAGLILGLSLTGVIGFQVLVYEALSQIPVVNAVLMLATMPVVILAMAAAGQRKGIPVMGWLAVLLSILGVAVLLTEGDLSQLLAARLGTGDLWMLAAVVLWSIYTLLLRRRPGGFSGNVLLLAMILPALPFLAAAAARWGATDFAALSGLQWSLILYIGVFPSLLAFLAWNYGVAKVGPEAAGFFINLMPVFATVLAWLLLGETISIPQLGGGALIVFGLVLSQRVSG
ncbi:MAG: DMT family transporter [Rhodobacteraceae bacterium]|nr:DMT family transporter [Paracoccaceae bacterium]